MVFAFLLLWGAAAPQTPPQTVKPPIPYSAYDGWNAIRGTTLSRDGHWLVYALVPEDGDGTLVARNLDTGAEHRAARGENPTITADGRFVVFSIAATRAARDEAKRKSKGKPPEPLHSGFGAMELATGTVFTVDDVKSFRLAANGSGYVAYLMEPPKAAKKAGDDETGGKKPTPGSDLVVRKLSDGTNAKIADVTDYAWAKSGGELAAATHNGVEVWTPTAAPRAVATGAGDYAQLAWSDSGTDLAFVSDQADAKANPPIYHLYRASGSAAAQEIADAALPSGMAVSEHGKVSFSPDGARLFFGIAPPPKPEVKNAPPIIQVDLWSWTDAELQPMQKVKAEQERDASYPAEALLHDPSGSPRVLALGSAAIPDLLLSADQSQAVLATDVPYQMQASWEGGDDKDYYRVSLSDGSHKPVLKDAVFGATLSPGGKYLLYLDEAGHHWHTIRLSDGRNADLTAGLSVAFQDERWDQPSPARPYGVAGWTANDAAVLIYDRYDIWAFAPDGGAARNLTSAAGRKQHVAYRYEKLNPEEKFIPSGPIFLSATNEDTMDTGVFRLSSSATPSQPARLDWRAAQLGPPLKAKDADALVFTVQRFDEFPDLWAVTAASPTPRKVSDANPQQAKYRWGSSKLIHYINRDGKKLEALLITPEGFDPHQQYPLMVYLYERLSQNLNHYVAPAPGTSINALRYASHGYVVLEPDIVYDTGAPGESAMKCVLPAIDTVQAMGFIDPHRIGIQGHSWGGYQIAYMVTHTNRFRAVEAGAVVANMTSAYGGIRWATGMVREFQYEHTQSRIGATPWGDPLLYLENSPLFSVRDLHTPYLTIANDADDAVPWYQGIEFFTALRRLHKPAWMFVFNGEKHGLRQRDNQKYWTVRLDEYFDYWLQGAPEPAWMKQGVPYLQRGEASVDGLYGTTGTTGKAGDAGSH